LKHKIIDKCVGTGGLGFGGKPPTKGGRGRTKLAPLPRGGEEGEEGRREGVSCIDVLLQSAMHANIS